MGMGETEESGHQFQSVRVSRKGTSLSGGIRESFVEETTLKLAGL